MSPFENRCNRAVYTSSQHHFNRLHYTVPSVFGQYMVLSVMWHFGILEYFAFDNNDTANYQDPAELCNILPLTSQQHIPDLFLSEQNVLVDESLTLMKRQLSFKQKLTVKHAMFGKESNCGKVCLQSLLTNTTIWDITLKQNTILFPQPISDSQPVIPHYTVCFL